MHGIEKTMLAKAIFDDMRHIYDMPHFFYNF